MEPTIPTTVINWPLWRKISFRFLFILLTLVIAPWTWLDAVPGLDYVLRYWYKLMDWMVHTANDHLFHVRPVLVALNGSGDTSYGWTQVWLFLSLAAGGCMVWSVADRKRRNYIHLNYWLCLVVRYYISFCALTYGLIKIFVLQMRFPDTHELATPLGDLLPMRFSWFFIGYSTPYQVFSGVMELVAGLLLLYRKTSTLGVMFAAAIFSNVVALNLCYDIPVKIFSLQLLLACLFLLANESNRIISFFILNRPAAIGNLYRFHYTTKWMRISRYVLKIAFIILALIIPCINNYSYYQSVNKAPLQQPVKNGVYAVTAFAVNGDTIMHSATDSLRWENIVLENGSGSMQTSDGFFLHRYNRAYFSYRQDSGAYTLAFSKTKQEALPLIHFRFITPDSNTIRMWGQRSTDSLYVELRRTNRHFQLAEKQFHWLSEYNR